MERARKWRRKRRSFTKELRVETVHLRKCAERKIARVTLDVDLIETALRV